MTNFDIKYADVTIPGEGPDVTGQPDIRTDAQLVAQAIQKFGGALQRIQDARDTTELSAAKSEYDNANYAAYRTYSTTGDPTARVSVLDELTKTKAQIVEGLSNRQLRKAFQKYRDNVDPEWTNDFAVKDLAIRGQSIEDQAWINIEGQLRTGDRKAAEKEMRDVLMKHNRVSQARGEEWIKNIPTLITFSRARQEIGRGKPKDAIDALSAMKGLSEPQLNTRDKLLRMANQQMSDNGDEFGKAMLKKTLGIKDLPILEQQALIEQLKVEATDPNNGFSLEQSRVMINYLDSALTPPADTDWDAYERVFNQIERVKNGEIPYRQARDTFTKEAPKLAEQEQKELIKSLLETTTSEAEELRKDPMVVDATDALTDFERNDYYMETDTHLEERLSPDEWRWYKSQDEDNQEAFRKIRSRKRLMEEKIKFRKWYEENSPTEEQVLKYLEDNSKAGKKAQAENWLWNFFKRALIGTSPAAQRLREPTATGVPVFPKTPAEVNALPSGTRYEWTDGKIYEKN